MGARLGSCVGEKKRERESGREKESLIDRVTNCSNKTSVNKNAMLCMSQSEVTMSNLMSLFVMR